MNRWSTLFAQIGSLWLLGGLLAGVVGSGLVTDRWLEAGAGTRVQALGAGKQLSVLVSHNQRRVLIASGSDGSAFSNAIGAALPPMFDSIDVLLIDPTASMDVIERARGLDVKRWFVLPQSDGTMTARTVNQSFAIDLGDSVLVIVSLHENSWAVQVSTSGGTILVAGGQNLAGHGQAAINLDGSEPQIGEATYPIVFQPAGKRPPGPALASISPGDVLSIAFDGDSLRLDGNLFAAR
jgi:hypothetical protein